MEHAYGDAPGNPLAWRARRLGSNRAQAFGGRDGGLTVVHRYGGASGAPNLVRYSAVYGLPAAPTTRDLPCGPSAVRKVGLGRHRGFGMEARPTPARSGSARNLPRHCAGYRGVEKSRAPNDARLLQLVRALGGDHSTPLRADHSLQAMGRVAMASTLGVREELFN